MNKKLIIFLTIILSIAAAPFQTAAINDVTINGIVNFDILTADTAVLTTVLAQSGGQVTQLDVQVNYIDITLDNASTITFNTTAAGEYIRIAKQSGSDDYTVSPSCPTSTATLSGTGAQVVLRLEVYTTDICPPVSGGGGHVSVFPTNTSIEILDNNRQTAECVESRNVKLRLLANNAVSMVISNNQNFIGAEFEPYNEYKDWQLIAGDGLKTVYVIYRSSTSDLSNKLSDTIELKTSGCEPLPPVPLPPEEPVITEPVGGLSFGDLLKAPEFETVYFYTDAGKRNPFPSRGTYDSWYNDFSQVKIVSIEILSQIPLGKNMTYKPGVKMIKIQSDPKVYAVDYNAVLRWVTSEQVAADLYGPDWNKMIDDVNPAFFMDYTIGEPLYQKSDFPAELLP